MALLVALASCKQSAPDVAAKRRIWDPTDAPQVGPSRAFEPIPAGELATDPAARARVLEMSFSEVASRLEFVEYHGVARASITRDGHTLPVAQDTVIETGLDGSFRVLEKNGAGDLMREAIYSGRRLFIRNGTGELRAQPIVDDQHERIREEAFEPLRVFLGYFGPRARLVPAGTTESSGRPAFAYSLGLTDGTGVVEAPPWQAPKRPGTLEGKLIVDQSHGVVLAADLTGMLEAPAPDAGGKAADLEVSLSARLRTTEGKEIKPASYIPTIARLPGDIDPLAFLSSETQTSTVIGQKAASRQDEPEDDGEEP